MRPIILLCHLAEFVLQTMPKMLNVHLSLHFEEQSVGFTDPIYDLDYWLYIKQPIMLFFILYPV